jgi:hypothetical protein
MIEICGNAMLVYVTVSPRLPEESPRDVDRHLIRKGT